MATKAEQQAFLDKIIPMAVADMSKTQILASLTIAQAILESGWGMSGLTKVSNNLFGIKGDYNGASVQYPTKEWDGSNYVNVNGTFKRYPSWAESLADHSALFHRLPRYANLIGETNYKEAARKVKEDGYATSPTYTQSLVNLIEQYQLYRYDALDPTGSNGMLFWYDNRVEYQYGVYGPASGRTHRGIDVDTTSDDWRVLATRGGTVVASTIVTDRSNLTWEWGHYVCVLDADGYRHYYCHLNSRSVKYGDTVRAGDEIGIMGKTGNAAYDKQAEHVHYEVRVSPYKSANAVDPTPFCKIPNTVGTTWNHKPGEQPEQEGETMIPTFTANKDSRLEVFSQPDVTHPIYAEEGTFRLPEDKPFAVYETGQIKGENGTTYPGNWIKYNGTFFGWVAELPGKFTKGSVTLEEAEKAGLVGGGGDTAYLEEQLKAERAKVTKIMAHAENISTETSKILETAGG